MKKQQERRKKERHLIDPNVIIIGCGVIGQVVDINEHGVGLTYTKRHSLPTSQCHLDLYGKSFTIKNIPAKIASEGQRNTAGLSLLSDRCGIQFEALQGKLRRQVDCIIKKHADHKK
jgi:hypothetical protein